MTDMKEPASASLPTRFGNFQMRVWPAEKGSEPVALLTPELDPAKPVLVRIHSECLTGDGFGSLRCDCCDQKEEALRQISASGNGVFIYLRQEGRGMGLFDKIRSYKLQEEGIDTHQANILLGHEPDSREYSVAKEILTQLGIRDIRLLTNNPSKVSEVSGFGFNVERAPIVIPPNEHNERYLQIKQEKFKHAFGEQQHYFYYGISYSDPATPIDGILSFVRSARLHPLAKIHIGLYVDHAVLSDPERTAAIRAAFDKIGAEKHALAVPHYNVVDPEHAQADIQAIKELFPAVTCIQLNDDSEQYLQNLNKAGELFPTLIAPLSDGTSDRLDNPEFRSLILERNAFILLDSSKGTGTAESAESLHEKISRCLDQGLNNIGLAGGFQAGALGSYVAARNYYKIDFSIDAESRLQTGGVLDPDKAIAYLSELMHE